MATIPAVLTNVVCPTATTRLLGRCGVPNGLAFLPAAIVKVPCPLVDVDLEGNCILTDNDGICDCEDECLPATALMNDDAYKLSVESYNVGALGTTYRFFECEDATDKLAVFGNNDPHW